jgi:beta-glucosidase
VLPRAKVGLVHNAPFFEPHRTRNPLDRMVRHAQDFSFTVAVLQALQTGRLGFPYALKAREVPGLEGSLDFFGLNYYGRMEVKFDPRSPLLMGRHVQAPTTRFEDTDWGQACARGLEENLVRLKALGVPLYVTENGIYDADDSVRPQFLVDHVRAMHRALARGADVRGYFHWSLVDNFEWAEGWHTPFGLVAVDRKTGARTPKRSAHLYADICRANGLPASLAAGVSSAA